MFCMIVGLLNANFKQDFRTFGDVFRYMPIFVGIISLSIEDYDGALQLSLGTIATQASIEVVKRSFELASKKGHGASISYRPSTYDIYGNEIRGDPKGMPSGHSGGAWSASSYVFYRYGFLYALPCIILSSAVSASRVVAERHTVPQVVVGAAIAWLFGYIFTSNYQFPLNIEAGIDSAYVSLHMKF